MTSARNRKVLSASILLPVFLAVTTLFVAIKIKNPSFGVGEAATPVTYTYTTGGSSYIWNEEFGARTSGDKWLGTDQDSKNSYLVTTVIGPDLPKGSTVNSAILTYTSSKDQKSPLYAIFHAEMSPGTHGSQTVSQWPKTDAAIVYKLLNTPWSKNQKIDIDVTSIVREVVDQEGTNGKINFTAHGGTTLGERMYVYGGDTSDVSLHPKLTIVAVRADSTPAPTVKPTSTPTNTVTPATQAPTSQPSQTQDIPAKNEGFVKRSGSDLYLNGQKMRFVGANIFWLGMNNYGGNYYPSQFEIDDALASAREMGANYVRSFGTISVGCSLCIEPSLGNFNDKAFQSLDYAVFDARKYGLKLILTLSDNYQYYTGGKYTFTNWRNVSNEQFFTNNTVINDFKTYIQKVLTHVNPLTGIAYKDDPTIMAWETGNELYVGGSYSRTSFSSWTDTISTYLKSLAPNQLVVDGRYGVDPASLSLPNVDIYSNHYRSQSDLVNEAKYVKDNGKAYMLGEFDWTGTRLTISLNDYLNYIKNSDVDVASFWSLFGRKDSGGFVPHGDGYTLHYPGDNSDMTSRAITLRSAFYSIRGLSAPAYSTPTAPTLFDLQKSNSNINITFRGSSPSSRYELQRSNDGGRSWTTVSSSIDETKLPHIDSSAWSGTALYRVRGRNLSGVSGDFSNVKQISK